MPLHPKLFRRATLCALSFASLTALGGCLTVNPTLTAGTNPACLALKPISYSHQDTAETVDQIRKNNAALAVLCPESPAH